MSLVSLGVLAAWLTGVAAATEPEVPAEPPPPAVETPAEPVEPEPAAASEPAAPPPASDPWEPRSRVVYSNLLALRVNPLGLIERVKFGWRHRLFEKNGPLFRGAWAELGAEVSVAPTYAAGGARFEIRPLTILSLSATIEAIGYFGVIDAVMPFASTQSDYWEDTISTRGEAGENYAAVGSRLTLSALVFGVKGPFAFRNQLSALRVELGLKPGDTLMYDATQDLVLPNGGWAILNDLDLGALYKRIAMGVRYSYADAIHTTDDGGPGDLPMHRIGPLLGYTFHDRPAGARFNRPSLLLLVQWYAQHPYRSGQEQTAAYPYIALAFQFDGDLWTSPK